jgi:serine/threonine protein kinase
MARAIRAGALRREPLGPGQRVHTYEIRDLLGRGGMSVVHRARHVHLGHEVALKTTLPEVEEAPERFLREARALATMAHANVVRVYDADVHDGVPYLVMEMLRGNALASVLREERLSVERTFDLLEQIGSVLVRQEEARILHRDLKPGNVWMREDGTFCVFDYGLAGAEEVDVHSRVDDAAITAAGVLVGTPQYMAPEQAEGRPATHATDLFGLGATAWHALVGRAPRDGEGVQAVLRAARQPLPDAASLRPDVPGSLSVLLRGLTALEPGDRYASARSFLEDLAETRHEGRPPSGPLRGTVFVAMAFRADQDPVFEAVRSACRAVRTEARRMDRMVYLEDIWNQIAAEIRLSRTVVADFSRLDGSGPNPNVLTEAAHARAIGRPLVVLTRDPPEDLPFDWRHVPVLRYAPDPAGLASLGRVLTEKLRHLDRRG